MESKKLELELWKALAYVEGEDWPNLEFCLDLDVNVWFLPQRFSHYFFLRLTAFDSVDHGLLFAKAQVYRF